MGRGGSDEKKASLHGVVDHDLPFRLTEVAS